MSDADRIVPARSAAPGQAAPAPHGPRTAVAALLAAVATYSVLQSMVLPAIPDIARGLGSSTGATSWVLSGFLLSSSVAGVVLGRLGDAHGRKRLLLVSVGALLVGSVAAALAPTIGALITARIVQGLGDAVFPLAYGLVRDLLPEDRVASAVGAVSGVFGAGFAVGLVLPQPLLAIAGWRAVFWTSAGIDLVVLLLVAARLPRGSARRGAGVDWPGAGLLVVAVCSLLLAISQARTWPWPVVGGLVVCCAVAVAALIRLAHRTAQPLIEPALLRRPAVAVADAAGLLVGLALFGAFSVLPSLVESPTEVGGLAASPLQAGLLLLPTAIVMVVIGSSAGRWGARIGHAKVLGIGGATGVVGYAVLIAAPGSAAAIALGTTVLGVAVGLVVTAGVNLLVDDVDPSDTAQATSVNTVARTIGGALGAQLTALLLELAPDGTPGFRLAFGACGLSLAAVAVLATRAPREARS